MNQKEKIENLQKINSTLVKELENRDEFILEVRKVVGADNFQNMKEIIRNNH